MLSGPGSTSPRRSARAGRCQRSPAGARATRQGRTEFTFLREANSTVEWTREGFGNIACQPTVQTGVRARGHAVTMHHLEKCKKRKMTMHQVIRCRCRCRCRCSQCSNSSNSSNNSYSSRGSGLLVCMSSTRHKIDFLPLLEQAIWNS